MRISFAIVLLMGIVMAAPSKQPPRKLDVNAATAAQLEQVPGIGVVRAAQIVRLRGRNGPFRKIEELRALPRLSEKAFQQLRPWLFVAGEPEESLPPGQTASQP